jgi:superfamily II DNA or RNA helicase
LSVTITKSKNSPLFFINDIDQSIANVLDKSLSYYPFGFERTNAYIDGIWDGRECLFKRSRNGSYFFPTGLIEKVKTVVEAFGETITIRGIESYHPPHDRGTMGLEWASGYTLRDYQYTALSNVLASTLGGGVINLPTGGGKTLISLKYILYRDFPFCVLVHRRELLKQWQEEIKKHLGIDVGIIGNNIKEVSDVGNICMIQTLKRDHSLIPQSDVVIADECHIVSAQTVYDVCMHSNARFRLGLSATPYREDGADMRIWAVCGGVVANITVPDLVDMGYLARPEFRFFRLKPIKNPTKRDWATVYKEGIVSNFERNSAIVSSAIELSRSGRQVYVHVARIDHGTYLKNQIANHVDNVVFLDGSEKRKLRTEIIENFKNGNIRVLVSTLLKEGVDLPLLDSLIYAAGYKSSIMAVQTIGRALRKTGDKENAIIVDFIDSGQRMLAYHSDERFRAYNDTYGKYCQLNIVKN